MSKRAVIYVRDSTGQQASIQTQIEKCKEFAIQKNMTIVQIYIDTDNSFKQQSILLDSVIDNKIHHVLVHSLNRLGRNLKDVLSKLDFLKEHNIRFNTCCDEPIVNPMILSLFETISSYENQIVNEGKTEYKTFEATII